MRCAIAAVALPLLAGSAAAACAGRDLWPDLKTREPGIVAAIERAAAVPFGRGVLFRVSRPGTADSTLFGTMHTADARLAALPAAVTGAIEGARVVALELKEAGALGDPALLKDIGPRLLGAVLARTDERPDDLLGAADFARLQAAVVRRGLPVSAARSFKPAVLAVALSTPACAMAGNRGEPVMDARLARLAEGQGVPVQGLETVAEQLAVVSTLGGETGRTLLISALSFADDAEDLLETTIARYRAGEIGLLLAWMKSGQPVPGRNETTAPPEFFDRLIDERNRRMRDRALPELERGGVFLAVGAAHIPGPNGLARLIEDAGFRVEPLQGKERP